MKKLILTSILTALAFYSCDKKTRLKGNFYSENAIITFKTVVFDEEIGDFGLHGSGSYIIKNDKIYLDSNIGKIVFEIINKDSIKGVSHWIKNEIYVKQK